MNSTLYQATYKVLLSLVKLLLRKGVSFSEFMQIAKQAYVGIAKQQLFHLEGKATTSRIAIVTGLTRKDVAQLRKQPLTAEGISSKYNRATRVISGWLEDEAFCTPDGYPDVLPITGKEASFETLVNRYSGDMTTKAMLDELLRVGVIKRIEKHHVSLQRRAYVPKGDEDETLAILGDDVSLLINTINHNLNNNDENLYFQRKVCYNNLPEECLDELRHLTHQHSQQLLVTLNKWLKQQDRDNNPEIKGSGRKKAGLGIYYFEEDVLEPEPEKQKKPS